MELKNFLSDRRSRIIKKWCDLIIGSYPADTKQFISKEKDQFANPVGNIIGKDVEILFDGLIEGGDDERIAAGLNNIIKIRAVQDFKPSQAVSFVLELKDLVMEELDEKGATNGLSGELHAFGKRIDKTALLAFDIYSQCRQKIYEIRVNEVKNQVGKLLKRANLTVEIPEKRADF
jgi:hypothetical protein